MPTSVKFLKDILLNKRKLKEFETIVLLEKCSIILQNKLLPKLKDLGSFFIPSVVGSESFNKVLYDLRASISLIPLSICKRLDIRELKSTTVTLQLAN